MSTSVESKSDMYGDAKPVVTTSTSDTANAKDSQALKRPKMEIKRSRFEEIVNWLKQWGFKVTDKTKETKIQGIEFQAEILPQVPYSSGLSTPFYLEFQDDLDDGLIIRTTFELDKNIEIYLNSQNRAREIELTYIEIYRLVLPLRISIIREHPFIKLFKIIFTQNLDKQLFFDSITDLMNSMSIIIGKWDEKYYQSRPVEKKVNKENKITDFELEKILKK
ncbi:hypothetical protein YTPLAS21_09680 [Candidatus Nitrosocosmicus sp.]|uniref:hypothetical protein n=1 Tax=Candidatus Nitrosocosmicus sp. FF01 TaxID=3397670 RepID=UPI002ACC4257|nr:hypothetical protein YTPLAS21_09680 [Candidatus Nitrosocosmicus sp.]